MSALPYTAARRGWITANAYILFYSHLEVNCLSCMYTKCQISLAMQTTFVSIKWSASTSLLTKRKIAWNYDDSNGRTLQQSAAFAISRDISQAETRKSRSFCRVTYMRVAFSLKKARLWRQTSCRKLSLAVGLYIRTYTLYTHIYIYTHIYVCV